MTTQRSSASILPRLSQSPTLHGQQEFICLCEKERISHSFSESYVSGRFQSEASIYSAGSREIIAVGYGANKKTAKNMAGSLASMTLRNRVIEVAAMRLSILHPVRGLVESMDQHQPFTETNGARTTSPTKRVRFSEPAVGAVPSYSEEKEITREIRPSGDIDSSEWSEDRRHQCVLNGNNGSWTGTDDVDDPDRADFLRRARLQFFNRQNRRPMDNNLRNDEDNFEERPVGVPHVDPRGVANLLAANRFFAIQNAADEDTVVDGYSLGSEEESVWSNVGPVMHLGVHLVKGVGCDGWDGRNYYHFDVGLNQFRSSTGTTLPWVHENDIFNNAVDSGIGYLEIVDEGGESIKAQSCSTCECLPEYGSNGVTHCQENYMVFWPLYNVLAKKYPTCLVKQHTRTAAHSTAERDFMSIGVPRGICVSTVRYFCAIKTCMQLEELKNTPGYSPEDSENDNTYYVHDVGVTVEHGAVTVGNGVSCALVDNYRMNNQFSIRMHGGLVTVDRRDGVVDLDTIVYPVFNTLENIVPKFKRTIMFNFAGQGVEPFLLYDVNGANAGKACKRLLSARDEELVYTHCQYRYGYHLARSINQIERNSILAAMRVRLGFETVRVGFRDDYHEVDFGIQQQFVVKDRLAQICPLIPLDILNDEYDTAPVRMLENQVELVKLCHRDVLTYVVDLLKTKKNWLYYVGYDAFLTHLEPYVARAHLADQAHVKRQLRKLYVEGAVIHDTEDLMVARLGGCVKRELAKHGKVPRLFVSYGAGSMYAGNLPEYFKNAIDGEHHYRYNGVAINVYVIGKPRSDMFDEAFEQMRDAVGGTDEIYIVLYSDDSVYSGNLKGVPFLMNVDISSCDAGQKWPIFLSLHQCMSVTCPKLATGLVKQCTLPIDVRNPSNPEEMMTVTFDGPFEGSGTVLTTVMNDVGNLKIAQNVCHALAACRDHITDTALIMQCITFGAALTGHKVTIEDCGEFGGIEFERAQLLKHSMLKTETGEWTYSINYGTIFRSLGTLEGDMTQAQLGLSFSEFKTTLWTERLDMFVGSVVQGLKHEPGSLIMDALRQRFTKTIIESVATKEQRGLLSKYGLFEQVERPDRGSLRLDDMSVCNRYGCTIDDLACLANKIKGTALGFEYVDLAVGHFYAVDYGAPVRQP